MQTFKATLIEYNGVGETPTEILKNINFGDADKPNLDAIEDAIKSGQPSFEKYFRIHFTGTFDRIFDVKIWKDRGEYRTGEKLLTNAREEGYDGSIHYDTPSKLISEKAIYPLPNSKPNRSNIGLNGSLKGVLTEEGYSDWIVIQVQSTEHTPHGKSTPKHKKGIAFSYSVI